MNKLKFNVKFFKAKVFPTAGRSFPKYFFLASYSTGYCMLNYYIWHVKKESSFCLLIMSATISVSLSMRPSILDYGTLSIHEFVRRLTFSCNTTFYCFYFTLFIPHPFIINYTQKYSRQRFFNYITSFITDIFSAFALFKWNLSKQEFYIKQNARHKNTNINFEREKLGYNSRSTQKQFQAGII